MSSISFGSSIPVSYQSQTQGPAQQLQANVKQLAQSLQSGDLSGAQKAYTSLQQTLGTDASSSTNPLNKDLSSLGQALQSGNLSGAQQAFAQLGQDAQTSAGSEAGGKSHGAHHHHHHAGGTTGAASLATSTQPSTAGSPIVLPTATSNSIDQPGVGYGPNISVNITA